MITIDWERSWDKISQNSTCRFAKSTEKKSAIAITVFTFILHPACLTVTILHHQHHHYLSTLLCIYNKTIQVLHLHSLFQYQTFQPYHLWSLMNRQNQNRFMFPCHNLSVQVLQKYGYIDLENNSNNPLNKKKRELLMFLPRNQQNQEPLDLHQ